MGKVAVPLLTSLGASAATAGTLSTIVSGIGTAMSLMSSFTQNAAQQQGYAAEIESTKYNSAVERLSSAQQESAARREQYLRAGAQKAAGGAQGRGQGGNILDIMADTAYQSELDILGLRTGTELNSQLAKSRVSGIKKTAKLSTASNLLTGVSTLAGSVTKGINQYSSGAERWSNGDPFRTR
jgi:hypothetical protein